MRSTISATLAIAQKMTMLSNEMSTLSSEGESVRERKKRDKEARIRAAALALFRDKGYEATTTREVAERAGIAAGTLFLYVKTKEELLDFVFAGEIAAVVDDAWRTLPHRGDVVTLLMHPLSRLLEFYARDLAMARLLVREAFMPSQGSRSVPLTMDFLSALSHVIAHEQATGALSSDVPPLELALHAFQLYVGAVLSLINGFVLLGDACEGLRRALEVHLRGLRPAGNKRRFR